MLFTPSLTCSLFLKYLLKSSKKEKPEIIIIDLQIKQSNFIRQRA